MMQKLHISPYFYLNSDLLLMKAPDQHLNKLVTVYHLYTCCAFIDGRYTTVLCMLLSVRLCVSACFLISWLLYITVSFTGFFLSAYIQMLKAEMSRNHLHPHIIL